MLPKKNRLSSKQFSQTLKKSNVYRGNTLNIRYRSSFKPITQVAIVISKKIDPKATKRNKLKRQISSAIRSYVMGAHKLDLIFFLKTKTDSQNYINEIMQWLKKSPLN